MLLLSSRQGCLELEGRDGPGISSGEEEVVGRWECANEGMKSAYL
jgi:hypothetical protein